MSIFTELKEGDTFYYVLKSFRTDEHWSNFIEYNVFPYEFHKNDNYYDKELMFNTKEEAEKYINYLMNAPWSNWNYITLDTF